MKVIVLGSGVIGTTSAWHLAQAGHEVRALMLERERIANHLGDLGALGNDAAFAFARASFSALERSDLLVSL